MRNALKVSLLAAGILGFVASQYAWADIGQVPGEDIKAPSGFSAQDLSERENAALSKIGQKADSFGHERETKPEMLTPAAEPERTKKGCSVIPKPKDPGFVDPVKPGHPRPRGCFGNPDKPKQAHSGVIQNVLDSIKTGINSMNNRKAADAGRAFSEKVQSASDSKAADPLRGKGVNWGPKE